MSNNVPQTFVPWGLFWGPGQCEAVPCNEAGLLADDVDLAQDCWQVRLVHGLLEHVMADAVQHALCDHAAKELPVVLTVLYTCCNTK